MTDIAELVKELRGPFGSAHHLRERSARALESQASELATLRAQLETAKEALVTCTDVLEEVLSYDPAMPGEDPTSRADAVVDEMRTALAKLGGA